MIRPQPLPNVRRQQKTLLTTTINEVPRHPASLLNPPDGTPLCDSLHATQKPELEPRRFPYRVISTRRFLLVSARRGALARRPSLLAAGLTTGAPPCFWAKAQAPDSRRAVDPAPLDPRHRHSEGDGWRLSLAEEPHHGEPANVRDDC